MLALQQAYEVKVSIIEYLKATYSFQDKAVQRAFLDLIENSMDGMFKGPYVSLKLPYKKFEGNLDELPLAIKPIFRPFTHQAVVFERLSTENGNNPLPTILTTGTASGKTEAFLYPLLDYCFKNKGQKGIKAIILYPMNALATDQAQRIAEAIYADERTRGKVTAGLFIGEGQGKKKYPKDMGEKNIIEERDTILSNPPDILLTNFKMLDYALMRSKFHELWQYNFEHATLLKFLVLDELHTYDGAQGTDVANLIRRLKLKLNLPKGYLCPVGTSATIGSGDEAPKLLADYATKVFGEDFNETSIIGETRIDAEEFFGDVAEKNFIPTDFLISESRIKATDSYQTYIQKQLVLWGLNPKIESHQLGDHLKQYKIVRDLLKICNKGVIGFEEITIELGRANNEFKNLADWSDEHQYSPKETLVRSILTLISEAKVLEGEKKFPLLYVQVQLWIRELSGILRLFQETPLFSWKDSVSTEDKIKALPPYFCRECGTSGWATIKHDNRNNIEDDIKDTYQKYFSNHKNLYFTNTYSDENLKIDEYAPSDTLDNYVDVNTLGLFHEQKKNRFKIISYRKVIGTKADHVCPVCNSRNTIAIIGTKTATLSSISISQVISSELDKTLEKDRKVLAFTNGVQDAAHQAGFIEARNYKFTFRAAMQRVINEIKTDISLSEYQKLFKAYWLKNADETGKKPIEAYLYKFFPADHQGDVKIVNYKKAPEKFIPEFIEEFNRRMDWEISTEVGYNAIIGRTLEKTGSSGTYFKREDLANTYDKIKDWLDLNSLNNITKNEFTVFLNAFLHRLRTRGGIDHPYLNKFRTEKSSYYLITGYTNKKYFLIQNFGKKTRLPKFITDQANTFGVFDLTAKSTSSTNWFHVYFRKSFPLASNADALVNEFYTKLLTTLASDEIGILDAKNAEGIRNFSLKAEKLFLSPNVETYSCNQCKNELHISDSENLQGAACLSFRCVGHYELEVKNDTENYYKQVYNRQRSPRIYATEHTGLLERSDRERKEYAFKQRPFFNSLNALVATSTLEMGINIGDLNTTFNNSIPPLPSNFIQRVGRAGRASGSALIVNFATNDSHDQYYFQEPKEMMQGEVNSPGCYLEAKEILKRHFLAFSIDEWTKSDHTKNSIPVNFRIRPFHIEFIDPQDPTLFFNRIITFIKTNESVLFERFTSHLLEHVSLPILEELKLLLRSDSFYLNFKVEFSQLKEEVKQLKEKQKYIQKYIEENKLGETDEVKEQLLREFKNIGGTIHNILKRSVLEHLTNVGLLPNYAFPETGVVLNAQVRNRNLTGVGDSTYTPKSIELVRPAKSALRELVPDNLFYTQGYKLKITGLNVISWKEEALDYRFCSKCDHIESDSGQQGACPKCADYSWGSINNKHKFVKLKAVKSFNDEATSTLDDASEQREEKISKTTQHFNFTQSSTQGAWAMVKIPFGIEYIKEVDVYEVNYGLSEYSVNRPIKINETEVNLSGYITCKHCGKSSSDPFNNFPNGKLKERHYVWCKKRDVAYNSVADNVFEEVYLYRQLKTEAIKILLPVQEFESESLVAMFKSGIELGLKHYYKGNPQHIEICQYKELNKQTSRNDRFLVLYDTIPGGTGYLAKLFNEREFSSLIDKAYKAIKDCTCQYNGKDGCYRCIYTYGNQFEREELSRQRAEELFRKIYVSSDKWDYLQDGLNDVTNSGKIEESELEERFIRALKTYFSKEDQQLLGWNFETKTEDGINLYSLQIKRANTELHYLIRPQISLGESNGVKYYTRCDHLIICTDVKINGESISDNELNQIPSIAIYLDGYQFHASKENNRFFSDIKKRIGIIESNTIKQWSLTWDDLTRFENQITLAGNESDELHKKIVTYNINYSKIAPAPIYKSFDSEFKTRRNNLDRLLYVLENIYKAEVRNGDLCKQILFPLQLGFLSHSFLSDQVKSILDSPTVNFDGIPTHKAAESYCMLDDLPLTENIDTRIFIQLNSLSVLARIIISHNNEGWDKRSWENFWNLFNLYQFFWGEIGLEVQSLDLTEAPKLKESIDEIFENFGSEYHNLITELINKGVDFNRDCSFYLEDDYGAIIAEATIGFHQKKIFIDPFDDNSREVFQKNGYIEKTIDNLNLNDL